MDGLRSQIQLHNYIARRDLPKRFATVQFLHCGLWVAGMPALALANLAWLAVFEAIILWLIRTTPPVTQISPGRVRALLLCSTAVSLGYYAPGLILALQPDAGLATGGMAWILAALSTNLVMYNALPAFFWTTALPGIPAALAAVLLGWGKPVAPAEDITWLLPISIVVLYVVNTLQQLWEYRDTHRELDTTRSELLKSLRRLEHMTAHDALTGLKNRAAFGDELKKRLSRAGPQQVLGVLMIDLNGFKPINDSYGHEAGDAVLVTIAQRLNEALRTDGTAYRLGGDEFAVLSHAQTTAELQVLGDRLAETMRVPVPYGGKDLRLGGSIGIAVASAPEHDPDQLCGEADVAMYQAKSTRSKTAVLHEHWMENDRLSDARRTELDAALREGKVRPVYQPKYATDGSGLAGLEALARWDQPDGPPLLPEAFLEDMDKAGLLSELTHVMLKQVLADMADWAKDGLTPGRVSVNIPLIVLATESGRDELTWLLAQRPEQAATLAFEVTEDVYLARSSDLVAASIRHFKELGVQIYLDDFGTGYASYQHLRALTPDCIKIDRSIVAEIGTDHPAEVVIAGFIAIAAALGATVVAEGVETEEQRDLLTRLGCSFLEGHLFMKALGAAEVAVVLPAEQSAA